MDKKVKEYMSKIGKKGGVTGKGQSKVRGDSEYYRRMVKAKIPTCLQCGERGHSFCNKD